MRTQMATAALLAGVGDVIAQRLEGATTMAAFAWRRFAALVFVNVFYIVPLLSVLYAANDKLVGERTAKHGEVSRTGAMLAVDQLLFNPTLPPTNTPIPNPNPNRKPIQVDQLLHAPLCILGFYYAFR